MQIKYVSGSPIPPASPLRKLVGLVVTVAVLALALMFSAVLLVVIVILGTLGWVWLWWKTRELRKRLREAAQQGVRPGAKASNDEVFEGEVIRVVDPKEVK